MLRLPFWKIAPFSRLCFSLIAGILVQYYFHLPLAFILFFFVLGIAGFLFPHFIFSPSDKRRALIKSIFLQLLILITGSWLCWQKDIRHNREWYGNVSTANSIIQARLEEEPQEKENSYKAEASIIAIDTGTGSLTTIGRTIIYFSKPDVLKPLKYGDEILIRKKLQPIKNAGNPGGFDYERYASFHQWFHTVYLKKTDYVVINTNSGNWFRKNTIAARLYVVSSLKKHLPDDKNVISISEAILIGYKEDLDKNLVQEYSNAGIVHLIAISGMHLGMIYLLLELILRLLPFAKNSRKKIIPILILLWAFAVVTGATPSVLRSALMFTCILIGKNYFKQPSSYNSLAISAFILLCINPYYLWDVGFQLSYLAVGGIMWLQRPIYHLIYTKNKAADWVWQLASVSLAAQIVTFPLSLLYFHQFPVLFLFTNILAIPLAMAGLYSGVALIVFSFIPVVAHLIGYCMYGFIWMLNYIVHFFNGLKFSLIQGVFANGWSTLFLYLFIAAICFWAIGKKQKVFAAAIIFLAGFGVVRSLFFFQVFNQKKIIVYNVPRLSAIDFIDGEHYFFRGDSSLLQDAVLQNFHLKPSRIFLQSIYTGNAGSSLVTDHNANFFYGKTVLVADSTTKFLPVEQPVTVDVLVITKSSPYLEKIIPGLTPAMVVCDGTNNLWKIARYKKDCEALHLPFHAVAEDGAYVLDIQN